MSEKRWVECGAYYQLWNILTGTPKVGHPKIVNRDSESGTEGISFSQNNGWKEMHHL